MAFDDSSTAVLEPPDTLSFEAADVTGLHEVQVSDVQRSLPAREVARALAARMALPDNVTWALRRDDTTGAYLDDEAAIGDQIGPDARLTVTPKTHLGGV